MSEMNLFGNFPEASDLQKREIEEEERYYALEKSCENAQYIYPEKQESLHKVSGTGKKKKSVLRINPSAEMGKFKRSKSHKRCKTFQRIPVPKEDIHCMPVLLNY